MAAGPPPPPPPLLLGGPPGSGRSALLFRAALAAPPGPVLFLAPRPLQRLPGPEGGGPAEVPAPALQRIQFLYPTSLWELLQLLASLHEAWPGSGPSLVVLDSLEEYLAGCPGPHVAAQLAALLVDTTDHFSGKGSVDGPSGCHLIVSVRFPGESGDGAEWLLAIRRYFLAQCWLHLETREGGGPDGQGATKLVRARLSQPGADDREWLLRFEPQEEMKISPLPCQMDEGPSSGSERHPAGEAHPERLLTFFSELLSASEQRVTANLP